jgi:hypothetical protein
MIRGINDPEHPLTLEELNVVDQSLIEVRRVTVNSAIILDYRANEAIDWRVRNFSLHCNI